ncbi:MAG: NAD(P)-dependent oxidoreductase [Nakamurella sp.]
MTNRRISTVAVTGGSGKLGRAVVRDLLEHGYTVVTLDRVPPPAGVDNPFVRVDLTDYGQVFESLHAIDDRHTGIDAVVHLGAIPAPGMVPNAALFTNNVTATYNVFAAAKAAGIKRVVWASSETVLGLPFDTPPPYIPVDEEYPPRPESSYSLSKRVEESMAEQFCRWDPQLTMIGLRFSNVMDPGDYTAFPSFDADASARKWNLWGYIDARDGAQSVRKALEADLTGREIFIIAAADTVMTRPNAELVAEVFPGMQITGRVGDNETLLSIDKARRLLGFDPQYSWRDEV